LPRTAIGHRVGPASAAGLGVLVLIVTGVIGWADLTTAIVTEYAGIGFNDYAARMIPIALAGWVTAYFILRAVFRRELTATDTETAVPTVSDFVPGYEASSWSGIGVPRNTPAEIIEKAGKGRLPHLDRLPPQILTVELK
jgi:hypothetical protein